MKHNLKKYLSAVMAVALLMSVTACSDRQPPAEEIKSSSEPISISVAEPPISEGQEPTFSGEAVLSALAPFTVAGYDYEPGDFSHQFTLTDAQQAEFNKLLRASEWEEITDIPQHGFTEFLRAINTDGYYMAVGEWYEENSFVKISDNPNYDESTLYLAPRAVVEDAKLFLEQLKEQETTQKPEGKPTGTEFEIDTVKFKLALPEGWTAKGNEIYADDIKIAELLPCVKNSDGKAFEALDVQYVDAEVVKECTAGNYSGKYYHMQSEVSEGGLTVLENELLYYIDIGDQLLHFGFYPVFGVGIGTQREAFEAMLNTIGFHQ